MKFKNKYTKRLLNVIPGGCHTYSRGADTFPENAPSILEKGKGVYIFDRDGNKFLDNTLNALEKTLFIYKKALKTGVKKFLKGHVIKPVFRKFN